MGGRGKQIYMSFRTTGARWEDKQTNKQTNKKKWGWRDGSVVKSTDCSSRGPEFYSQQPHGGSQPFMKVSDALFRCV